MIYLGPTVMNSGRFRRRYIYGEILISIISKQIIAFYYRLYNDYPISTGLQFTRLHISFVLKQSFRIDARSTIHPTQLPSPNISLLASQPTFNIFRYHNYEKTLRDSCIHRNLRCWCLTPPQPSGMGKSTPHMFRPLLRLAQTRWIFFYLYRGMCTMYVYCILWLFTARQQRTNVRTLPLFGTGHATAQSFSIFMNSISLAVLVITNITYRRSRAFVVWYRK